VAPLAGPSRFAGFSGEPERGLEPLTYRLQVDGSLLLAIRNYLQIATF